MLYYELDDNDTITMFYVFGPILGFGMHPLHAPNPARLTKDKEEELIFTNPPGFTLFAHLTLCIKSFT